MPAGAIADSCSSVPMRLQIPNVLTPEELTTITTTLAAAEFVEGKRTAGWHAQLVKENQQLSAQSPAALSLGGVVRAARRRHSLFQAAVRPRRVHSLLFSRYDVGMAYGRHTDNALMGGSQFL